MKKWYSHFCCMLIILFFCTIGASGKNLKIAMLYRANTNFANELNALNNKGNWTLTPVKNSDLDSFSKQLNQYDMIVIGSLANYDKKVEFGKYGKAWRSFVKKGGVLVVLDANYVSSLNRIIHHMGNNFKVTTQGNCVQYSKKVLIPAKAEFAKGTPLLFVPNNLEKIFEKKLTWAHFSSWPKGWKCLVKCPDSKGTLLYRKEGKGYVFLTAWGGFGAPANQLRLRALIENISAFYLCNNAGLRIDKFNTSPLLLGKGKVNIVVSNVSSKSRNLRLRLRIMNNKKQIAETVESVRLTAFQKVELRKDYFINNEGKIAFDLELTTDQTTNIRSVKNVIPSFVVYRSVIYPAIKNAIPYSVRISEGTNNKCFLLLDNQYRFNIELNKKGKTLFLDGSKLKPGGHSICLVGVDASGQVIFRSKSYAIDVLSKNPSIYVDKSGYVNKSNQRIFPVGIYHVIPQEPLAKQMEFLDYADKYGFSFVHISGQMGQLLKPFLETASKKDIMVIVEHINAKLVQRFKHYNSIFAWNVGDEPEAHNKSPEQVLKKYLDLKKIDHNHPVYTVLAVKETIQKYSAVADIIAHDCYPIPNRPIEEVYSNLKYLVKVIAGSRSPFGVIQIHGYTPGNHFGPTRIPNSKEVRNMTYQAVAAGVKGLIFYTYKDTYGGAGFNINKHLGVYKETSLLPGEIKHIEPYLLYGSYSTESAGNDLVAGMWKKDGKTLMVAVNCSRTPKEYTISIDHTKVKPVNRSRMIFKSNGKKLTLSLQPLEVFVAITE